jgi:hypothetical protein
VKADAQRPLGGTAAPLRPRDGPVAVPTGMPVEIVTYSKISIGWFAEAGQKGPGHRGPSQEIGSLIKFQGVHTVENPGPSKQDAAPASVY